MDKISSGITGFDELTDGGFNKSTVTVLGGTPGTGKTIFGLQFLVNGAKKGEKGIYIALEERIEDVHEFTESFGWDLISLAKDDMITLHQYKISSLEEKMSLAQYKKAEPPTTKDIFYALKQELDSNKYARAVIDSVSLLKLAGDSEKETRAELASLLRHLKLKKLTVVLIAERLSNGDNYDFEDFLADSVIQLRDYPSNEERKRGITVLKMRGSKIDRTTRPYFITDKGITVYPTEHLL